MASGVLRTAIADRGLVLDASLLPAVVDVLTEFGLTADVLCDALEAATPPSTALTAADVARVRQQMAKKVSRDPLRGGASGAHATSPDGMGTRYDKNNIHSAGSKRPSSSLTGAGTSPLQSKTARMSPSVSPSSQVAGASEAGPHSAASKALYAARVNQGVVADTYMPPSGEPAAEGTCYALTPMAELLAKGFAVGEPMAHFSKAPGSSSPPVVLSNVDPLPLVCSSVKVYGAVTGLVVDSSASSAQLLRSQSVTFSPAHAARLVAAPSAGVAPSTTSPASSPQLAATAGSDAAPPSPTFSGSPGTTSPGGSPGAIGDPLLPPDAAAAAGAGLSLPGATLAIESDGNTLPPPPAPLVHWNIDKPFTYGFTGPKEKAATLDDRLEFMAEVLIGAYDGLGELQTPLGTVSQAPLVYIGRVATASDGASADARINASSVLLEGGAEEAALSGVSRVLLDISELPAFSLFPGQVVAARGVNARGDRMVVQALYHGAAAPPAALPERNVRALAAAAAARGSGPLRVWAAAGPFCLHHELDYTPLKDLFAEVACATPPPDVLILQGPFVEADHPRVRGGDLRFDDNGVEHCLTPQSLWTDYVVDKLFRDFLDDPRVENLHLVLQPAWNDAICHPLFPQWPLDKSSFLGLEEARRRITVVSNPATFMVGDLVVSATSTDVLFNINKDEATRLSPSAVGGGPKLEKVPRLAQHLLEQRCFFPLFPAPPAAAGALLPGDPTGFASADAAVPLELSQLEHTLLPCTPDILLLPSKLKAFARPVAGSLVVNSGALCRGNLGGTFAKITVGPPRVPTDAAAGYAPSSVLARASTHVVRI